MISESVRGEGAILLDKNGNRFVNELLPRDVVAEAIFKQMEKDQTDYVYEDLNLLINVKPYKGLNIHFLLLIQDRKSVV